MVKTAVLLFVAEVLKYSIRGEAANVPLFQFLERFLYQLDAAQHATHFLIFFLLKLSEYLGFYPDFSNETPYFSTSWRIFSSNPMGTFVKQLKYHRPFFIKSKPRNVACPQNSKTGSIAYFRGAPQILPTSPTWFQDSQIVAVVQQLFY